MALPEAPLAKGSQTQGKIIRAELAALSYDVDRSGSPVEHALQNHVAIVEAIYL